MIHRPRALLPKYRVSVAVKGGDPATATVHRPADVRVTSTLTSPASSARTTALCPRSTRLAGTDASPSNRTRRTSSVLVVPNWSAYPRTAPDTSARSLTRKTRAPLAVDRLTPVHENRNRQTPTDTFEAVEIDSVSAVGPPLATSAGLPPRGATTHLSGSGEVHAGSRVKSPSVKASRTSSTGCARAVAVMPVRRRNAAARAGRRSIGHGALGRPWKRTRGGVRSQCVSPSKCRLLQDCSDVAAPFGGVTSARRPAPIGVLWAAAEGVATTGSAGTNDIVPLPNTDGSVAAVATGRLPPCREPHCERSARRARVSAMRARTASARASAGSFAERAAVTSRSRTSMR